MNHSTLMLLGMGFAGKSLLNMLVEEGFFRI